METGKTVTHHPTAWRKNGSSASPDFCKCDFHGILLTECALPVAYLCWILIPLILWPLGKEITYSVHSSVSQRQNGENVTKLIHRVILYVFDDKIHAMCVAHYIVQYIVHCTTNNCISPDVYRSQDYAHNLYVTWRFKHWESPNRYTLKVIL